MHRRIVGLSIAAATSFLACAVTPTTEPTAQRSTSIRDGSPAANERAEVGLLIVRGRPDGDEVCTATLVSPDVVLTAGHCVTPNHAPLEGPLTGVFGVQEDEDHVRLFGVASYVRFGEKLEVLADVATDVALIRLAERVPSDLATPAAVAATLPARGAPLVKLGYGPSDCTRDDPTAGSVDYQKRKASYRYGEAIRLSCGGDSGGPSFGSDGRIYLITSAVTEASAGAPAVDVDAELAGVVDRMRNAAQRWGVPWPGQAGASVGTPTPAPAPTPPCTLTLSPAVVMVGEETVFTISGIPRDAVYGSWLGPDLPAPTPIAGWRPGDPSWRSHDYRYYNDATYTRQAIFHDAAGDVVCTTDAETLTVQNP